MKKTTRKIVKINIVLENKKVVNKLEKLNPNKKKFNQLSRDKVAVVIGIEKYAEEGALMLVESSARNYQNAEVIETYFRVNSFKILH